VNTSPALARSGAALLALGLLVTACATHGPPAPPGTADPATADAAVAATSPDRTVRVIFGWQAVEADARFTGRGVARIQPPYHARLDLFGPRGDTYLSAALVDDLIRLPPGVQAVQLPPPALMWAVLGVVRPPAHAALVGTREARGRTELFYHADGGQLLFVLEGARLRNARWDIPGRTLTVELRGEGPAGLPAQATYRDVAAYTELMLNLETVDEVEPFPPDIWTPGH
jgi:hypothetical protein